MVIKQEKLSLSWQNWAFSKINKVKGGKNGHKGGKIKFEEAKMAIEQEKLR